ncbi:MAG TPA: hypothetical protein VFQ50_11020, partial [Flavobacterium sp.]|nr:hypothetical protein [Flavobacterium sp.]
MKKIYLLVLLITGTVGAQDVFIPDPNFKAKLIAVGVDINLDGEIQTYEAEQTFVLDITEANISDLTGIEAFINLYDLNFSFNNVTVADLSANSALSHLYGAYNPLSTYITNSAAPLEYLGFNYTLLTSLDFSGNTTIAWITIGGTPLTSVDLTGCTALTTVNFTECELTSIDLSTCSALTSLTLTGNNLQSIFLPPNSGLYYLVANGNELTTIDVSSQLQLSTLDVQLNNLTSIDVSNNVALTWLALEGNELTTIDVSNLPLLNGFFITGNQQLETVFMKNGGLEPNFAYWDCPNLVYICADDEQISTVQLSAGPSVVVNSYCSFTPGGDYNVITGAVQYDSDNNGCDAADATNNFVKIGITSGTTSGSAFTNLDGSYNFYVEAADYTVAPILENPAYFTISPPSATVNFPLSNNSISTQNFCLTPNGVHSDAEMVIVPTTPARPGFDAVYEITFKNKGNQVLAGQASFTFEDAVMDYVSASVTPNAIASGVLTWNYTNL